MSSPALKYVSQRGLKEHLTTFSDPRSGLLAIPPPGPVPRSVSMVPLPLPDRLHVR